MIEQYKYQLITIACCLPFVYLLGCYILNYFFKKDLDLRKAKKMYAKGNCHKFNGVEYVRYYKFAEWGNPIYCNCGHVSCKYCNPK